MDLGGDCTNEDVLSDILRRLPVKSLVRFMCVSKSWSDLISGSYFINSHLRYNKSPFAKSHAVLGLTSYSFEYYKLANSDNLHQTLEHVQIPCPWRPNPQLPKLRPEKPKMFDGKVIRKIIRRGSYIVGHHNGLICACDVEKFAVSTESCDGNKGINDIIEVKKLFVCNPMTRRFKILPDSDIEIPELPIREGHRDPVHCRSLLYKRWQVVGFGFVDEGAYKVVRVTYGIGDHFRQFQPPWVEVYDSRSDSWRRVFVDHNLSCELISGDTNNFVDGSLYWLGSGYHNRDCTTLVSFNLVEEKLSEVLLWSGYNGNEDDIFSEYDHCEDIAILGESVALFVADWRNNDHLLIRVWKMDKKEGEVSWTQMYRFNFNPRPIGICRDGELLLCPEDSPNLILYDPKKMEDGCNVDNYLDLGIKRGDVDVTDFVESLLLLDGETCNTEEEEVDSIAEETGKEEEEEVFELGVFFDEN